MKKETISAQQQTVSSCWLFLAFQLRIAWYVVSTCSGYFRIQDTEKLKVENRYVEWWLRQRESISHSATTCCSTSGTNSRAECLLSVNESLICCTMEMGRRVCGPCCFLHQCLASSQTAPHEPTLIFSYRSLKDHKPETFISTSCIAFWRTFIKPTGLKVNQR